MSQIATTIVYYVLGIGAFCFILALLAWASYHKIDQELESPKPPLKLDKDMDSFKVFSRPKKDDKEAA